MFLITQAFWCWYWKVIARLGEQQKTNLYLEAIYKLLAQGNAISAVTAETLLNSDRSGRTVGGFSDSDIPGLYAQYGLRSKERLKIFTVTIRRSLAG